jgi:competence protein ComGC
MRRFLPRPARGFTFIGIIIVLAIIGVLSYNQMGGGGAAPNPVVYKERSSVIACRANRTTMKTMLAAWGINNQGRVPTIEDLQRSGQNPPGCPDGGKYTIMPDGAIHCTKHDDRMDVFIRKRYKPDMAKRLMESARIQEVMRWYKDNPVQTPSTLPPSLR